MAGPEGAKPADQGVAADMNAPPHAPTIECRHCPSQIDALMLVETRFERGICLVEVQCRHCLAFWTAEVVGSSREPSETARLFGATRLGWRILHIHRRLDPLPPGSQLLQPTSPSTPSSMGDRPVIEDWWPPSQ